MEVNLGIALSIIWEHLRRQENTEPVNWFRVADWINMYFELLDYLFLKKNQFPVSNNLGRYIIKTLSVKKYTNDVLKFKIPS